MQQYMTVLNRILNILQDYTDRGNKCKKSETWQNILREMEMEIVKHTHRHQTTDPIILTKIL